MKTYRPGRRLFYYSVALAALLLQIPVLALLSTPANGGESPAVLSIPFASSPESMPLVTRSKLRPYTGDQPLWVR